MMSPMEFKIEQDEKSNVFMASWDHRGGGGISTQANALPALYSAICASCAKLPCDLSGRENARALKRLGFLQGRQEGCTSDFRKLVCAYLLQTILTCAIKRCKALADKRVSPSED